LGFYLVYLGGIVFGLALAQDFSHGKTDARIGSLIRWRLKMCDCLDHLSDDLRSLIIHESERDPGQSLYALCFNVETRLPRSAYHELLRWADKLSNCPDCNSRPQRNSGWVTGAGHRLPTQRAWGALLI